MCSCNGVCNGYETLDIVIGVGPSGCCGVNIVNFTLAFSMIICIAITPVQLPDSKCDYVEWQQSLTSSIS